MDNHKLCSTRKKITRFKSVIIRQWLRIQLHYANYLSYTISQCKLLYLLKGQKWLYA